MEYQTGTYLVVGRKNWVCESCGKAIIFGVKHFVRVECYGPVKKRRDGQEFQEKLYERHHVECALALDNLNEFERGRLGEYFKTCKPVPDAQKQAF